MEVHHHPDLHHSKKKWKEYLLEFLMIFLAVTLGFFSETIRENISDRHREKDYVRGLLNNIKNDSLDLNGLIDRNSSELKGIDSLMRFSGRANTSLSVQDSIFFYSLKYTVSLHLFQFHDITLVQLRNGGGYALIKTGKVADSIALYESKNNDIRIQERFVTDYYVQTWTSFKQVFDGTVSDKFYNYYQSTDRIPADIPVMITKDEEKIHFLFNNFWTLAIVLRGYNNLLKDHLEFLRRFTSYLNKSYKLE